MQLPSPSAEKRRGRVDWSLDRFRDFVTQKGMDLTWQMSSECPCVTLSGATGLDLRAINDTSVGHGRAANCPTCKGSGVVLHSDQSIRAIVTDAKDKYTIEHVGSLRTATISISVLPEHLPSMGDRYTLNNAVMVRRETIKKGEQPKYPIVDRQLSLAGGATTVNVRYAHKNTVADGTTPLAGVLVVGQDYTVANGQISFEDTVADGTLIAIGYYASPVYVVTSQPHSIRDTINMHRRPDEEIMALLTKVTCSLEYEPHA